MTKCNTRNYNSIYPPVLLNNEIVDINWNKKHECLQPDIWDAEEFNLIIFLPEIGVHKTVIGRTIDFDFC